MGKPECYEMEFSDDDPVDDASKRMGYGDTDKYIESESGMFPVQHLILTRLQRLRARILIKASTPVMIVLRVRENVNAKPSLNMPLESR